MNLDLIVVGSVPEPDVGVAGAVECCHEPIHNGVFSDIGSACLNLEDVITSSRRRLCEMEIFQERLSIDFIVK
jgi:dihydroxyacetone kinase DhaKLM complex PTS-EIIA-like component DhaM